MIWTIFAAAMAVLMSPVIALGFLWHVASLYFEAGATYASEFNDWVSDKVDAYWRRT